MVIWNYGLLHFILIASIYYYFGVIKGIVALIFLYYTVKFIGIKIGYEICTGNDSVHMHDTEKVPHNCILIFELEKVGFDEMKKKMESTVIKHIKRYRQIPVNLLGFYFWKEVDKDTAKQQIVKCEKEIHNEKDVTEYSQKHLGIRMDKDKPQWQFIYVEDYQKDTSLCFFKFHHSFSDGGGIINSILFMNSTDKINQEMFNGRGIPLYMKIINGIILPFVVLIYCSFEQYRPSWKGHDKIKTKSGENSGEIICILSKTYKLNDIKRCYKRYDKITMNNFMMGLVSKSIYKWYQLNGVEEPKEIGTVVPVVMKPFSSNIDNIKMENCSSACNFKLL